MNELPHEASLRIGRRSEPGAGYLITKCRLAGQQLSLAEPPVAQGIADSIHWHLERSLAYPLGFVVMPDHFHWVLVLGHERSLEEVMHGLSGAVWNAVRRAYGPRVGKVWQDEYHDHRLRSDEWCWAKIQYVHENPVRKGLCARAEDWPWSTANPRFRGLIATQYLRE
ncbi:MAG TPA: hypothetical protein PLE19_22665 [Planctomycetota bacterium]|nr:hypothetical protein [Planctomycetota bacterium]HRR83178.1 hypothetical protein [Planctomycetota bacterium]HRT97000.1 hypothetical protein [Planctomycetota bacterium]